MKLQLADIRRVLAAGGYVRFDWAALKRTLHYSDGSSVGNIDGRSYQAITRDTSLIQTETGTVEGKDLIIEWRGN